MSNRYNQLYLINTEKEDILVLVRGAKILEAVRDVPAGGEVEEDLRVHRPCAHTLARLSCKKGLKGTVSRDFLYSVFFPKTTSPGPIRDVLGPIFDFLLLG